jgi:hypothetical protein
MSELEHEILTTLVELEGVAKSPAAGPKPQLPELFRRLDNLAEQLPRGSDPNLRHYLRHKSYQKARLLLEGRDGENARGTC